MNYVFLLKNVKDDDNDDNNIDVGVFLTIITIIIEFYL